MANAKTREKRRAARLRKSEKAMLLKPDDEEVIEDEDLDLEEESESESITPEVADVLYPNIALKESEQVEKDYGYDMAQSYLGPTTWEEVDALEAAQEQAKAVSDASWTVRDIVRNIIIDPMMSPDDKAKAISNAGKGFGSRIKSIS